MMTQAITIENNPQKPNILVVDDDVMIRRLLKKTMAHEGYDCDIAKTGEEALEKIEHLPCDLLITDIGMPGINGIELSMKTQEKYSTDIIVMTGHVDQYQYDQILNLGITDFVQKPFSPKEIILRTSRILKERAYKKDALKSHEALQKAYLDSIHRLIMASEYRDEDTGDHIIRIGEYSTRIASLMDMPKKFIHDIHYASPMHDVGKIGIPDNILLKPGKLTHDEFEVIKSHTVIGAKLLSKSNSSILNMAEEIALNHHEKYDGSGYPNQICRQNIPISARIVSISDTFDALTSRRPYKDPYPPEIVFAMIKKERGCHFDPEIADVFITNFELFMDIRKRFSDSNDTPPEDFVPSQRDKDGF